jgi:hypothetical protein
MGATQRMYALNICAYKKQGMSEEDYHTYTSEKHAQSLKHLLVEKKIAGYTMVCRNIKLSYVLSLLPKATQYK